MKKFFKIFILLFFIVSNFSIKVKAATNEDYMKEMKRDKIGRASCRERV